MRKLKKDEIAQRIGRQILRDAIARGILPDPSKRARRYKFTWTYGNLSDAVYADNRSDARSQIKRELAIPSKQRLPVEVVIVREPNEDTTTSPETSPGRDD